MIRIERRKATSRDKWDWWFEYNLMYQRPDRVYVSAIQDVMVSAQLPAWVDIL